MRGNLKSTRVRFTATIFCLFVLLPFAARAQEQPPKEEGTFRAPELVELKKLDKSIKLDIRYATSNNFVGRPVYTEARAFLQRPAAEALLRVSRALRKKRLGLAVFDGYRPWSVTKLFWDLTPADKKQFVANPSKGSRHNRGCAVDLTLYDIKTGREVSMPSEYDDMTELSHINYAGGTPEQRRLRDLLRAAMEAEGFAVYEPEWWHYDYKDWRQYPILNLSFSEIRPLAKTSRRAARVYSTASGSKRVSLDCGMRISDCGLEDSSASNPQSEIRIPQLAHPLATARGTVSCPDKSHTI
ncbi:MAG TPA: M15 family metallopeptidase [Pyrinomonadaceae bacterium]|nr:M15 family metallopeptidase [Pyrinomonadaceae bacterium]